MSDIKELQDLDEATRDALKRVAGGFGHAQELVKALKEAENASPDAAIKDVHRGIRILRWVGRGERRLDQDEKKILHNLEELGHVLPSDLKTTQEDLHKQLTVAEAKLVSLASMFRGKVKQNLDDIKTDEALLKKYEDDPKHAEHLHSALTQLFKETESEVQELMTWLSSTTAILKSVQGFEETLEKLSS